MSVDPIQVIVNFIGLGYFITSFYQVLTDGQITVKWMLPRVSESDYIGKS